MFEKKSKKIKLPALSTLHYRLSKLDDNIGKSNIKNISRNGKKKLNNINLSEII